MNKKICRICGRTVSVIDRIATLVLAKRHDQEWYFDGGSCYCSECRKMYDKVESEREKARGTETGLRVNNGLEREVDTEVYSKKIYSVLDNARNHILYGDSEYHENTPVLKVEKDGETKFYFFHETLDNIAVKVSHAVFDKDHILVDTGIDVILPLTDLYHMELINAAKYYKAPYREVYAYKGISVTGDHKKLYTTVSGPGETVFQFGKKLSADLKNPMANSETNPFYNELFFHAAASMEAVLPWRNFISTAITDGKYHTGGERLFLVKCSGEVNGFTDVIVSSEITVLREVTQAEIIAHFEADEKAMELLLESIPKETWEEYKATKIEPVK